MPLFPPLAGFGVSEGTQFEMTLTLSAADQFDDANVALGSTVGNNAGAVTYAWTVTDPDGVDATASLDDDTAADPTLALSSYSGRVGGKWTATCTATDSLGSITKSVEWQVGLDGGFVLDTYDFSGTLNVSGSTVVVGGVTWTLTSGTWTSDANGLQLNTAGAGASSEMETTFGNLLATSVSHFRIALIFDSALNMGTGAASGTNWESFSIEARQNDESSTVSVAADRTTVSPSGQGFRARRSSPESSLKVAGTLANCTGLMFEISGARRSTNGNAFFRAYYSTTANPSLDTGLADWVQVASGYPAGLEQPDDAAVGSMKLDIRCTTGSAGAAFRADIAKIEVAAVR